MTKHRLFPRQIHIAKRKAASCKRGQDIIHVQKCIDKLIGIKNSNAIIITPNQISDAAKAEIVYFPDVISK